MDYGSTFEYNYIMTQSCDECFYNDLLFSFTAGRIPGSFYIMRAQYDSVTQDHTDLCIDYSQDYGKTYTTYCYNLDSTFTGMAEKPSGTTDYLQQNYPNPFNGETRIGFYLEKPARAEVVVTDLFGNIIKTLVSGFFGAGQHQVEWDGTK